MIELSNASDDKLYAAACHNLGNTAELRADYLDACARWYAALKPHERTTAMAAVAALDLGREPYAAEIASVLPPAPIFPPRLGARPGRVAALGEGERSSRCRLGRRVAVGACLCPGQVK